MKLIINILLLCRIHLLLPSLDPEEATSDFLNRGKVIGAAPVDIVAWIAGYGHGFDFTAKYEPFLD